MVCVCFCRMWFYFEKPAGSCGCRCRRFTALSRAETRESPEDADGARSVQEKKRRNGVKAVREAARATGQTRRAAAGGLSVFFACHESQRKTRVFDAVPTEVWATNGLVGRLNHADAAAPEFGADFSHWWVFTHHRFINSFCYFFFVINNTAFQRAPEQRRVRQKRVRVWGWGGGGGRTAAASRSHGSAQARARVRS